MGRPPHRRRRRSLEHLLQRRAGAAERERRARLASLSRIALRLLPAPGAALRGPRALPLGVDTRAARAGGGGPRTRGESSAPRRDDVPHARGARDHGRPPQPVSWRLHALRADRRRLPRRGQLRSVPWPQALHALSHPALARRRGGRGGALRGAPGHRQPAAGGVAGPAAFALLGGGGLCGTERPAADAPPHALRRPAPAPRIRARRSWRAGDDVAHRRAGTLRPRLHARRAAHASQLSARRRYDRLPSALLRADAARRESPARRRPAQGAARVKAVIITADDFGASLSVNEAIERAHRDGILGSASLMVAAPAAADAVRRARAMPGLRVGLHVVVVNGRPVLPAEQIPDLLAADGQFGTHLFRAGVRFFFSPRVRRQLEAEIRAQFAAFQATGLTLDHVDAQNHLHVHPTLFALIIAVGREYGLRAVRLPYEPFLISWRAAGDGFWMRCGYALLLAPWLHLMRARLRRARVLSSDFTFGVNDAGRMTAARVLRLLPRLPEGVSEILFHPALGAWAGASPATRGYAWADELDALTNPLVAAALERHGIRRLTFGELRGDDGA
ncbi:MAG: hopanoid biosynthesis-associated protein HpnK [bacterium]|nr:hopanoid biosynthesis-associated protein HpnK [bacterium]